MHQKCYFLTKLFPKDELYAMVQQIRRSAVSIPANINYHWLKNIHNF
nr:four helix bundle protein [Anabaena sp. UHCC 0187]